MGVSEYDGHYGGSPQHRDGIYHQGTVWGWLIGPFVLAHLRVYKNPEMARRFLEPMGKQITTAGLGTTLDHVIVRGAAGAGGYTHLTTAAGEPHLFRGDLAAVGSHVAGSRHPLACFAQLTDIHMMDVQSPARFEFPLSAVAGQQYTIAPVFDTGFHLAAGQFCQWRHIERTWTSFG